MKAISIQNLYKTYANGTAALKGINFEVAAGDFCALLGANGAGKTTIISILTGLVVKTSGNVEVFGHNIDTNHNQAKRTIGVVPQEMNFNLFERARDIVATQAGYYGLPRSQALEETDNLLKRLKLWDKRDQQSRALSGGMKRRLLIARALVNRPKLLILDEPTAGVDVELRHEMWEFIRELNGSGTTILLTTHYLEEVEQLCKNAAIIKNGEIIALDRVNKLIKLLDQETFIVHVEKINSLDKLSAYNPKIVDENYFEVDIPQKEHLNDFIKQLIQLRMSVIDLRPKGNRMEHLYLKVLKG